MTLGYYGAKLIGIISISERKIGNSSTRSTNPVDLGSPIRHLGSRYLASTDTLPFDPLIIHKPIGEIVRTDPTNKPLDGEDEPTIKDPLLELRSPSELTGTKSTSACHKSSDIGDSS